MAIPVSLGGQNWLITPAVDLPGARTVPVRGPLGSTISPDQLWLLVLTGLGSLNFAGNKTNNWITETVTIAPDMQAPLSFALASHGVQTTPLAGTSLGFNLVMWAPFAAISSVTYSSGPDSIEAGYALDVWRPTPFIPTLKDSSGHPVPQVFQGINVDISVLDSTVINGLSYNITLVGRIVHLGQPQNAPPTRS